MRNATTFTLLCSFYFLHAQSTRDLHQDTFSLHIVRAFETIKVDGNLSEAIWQNADSATQFLMKWPRDGGLAPAQTSVYCVADDKFLYFGFRCKHKGPLVIQSLKRDATYWDSDGVAIILDPTNSAGSGYFFGINASGVQTDGLLSAGSSDADVNWDNTWFSETKIREDEWTAEIAIPLRILRYKEGQTSWGVNFVRNDLINGIYSTWASVPFQFDGTDLGWTGALHWPDSPRRMKGNLNLIPYASAAASRDSENNTDWAVKPGLGMDAKIGMGSGLNLDLTANPDFSQIEIDEQVVNLTRFDVMLPEKRTFFLENADLFANFGIPPVRPFFSRRIGLNGDGEAIPILAGARLTGNVNADTRIGVMSMQTQAKNGEPARNFSAFAARYRVFGRTNVGGYMLNRTEFGDGKIAHNAYDRNAGIDFKFTSTDGRWSAWSAYNHSFQPGVHAQNGWGNAGISYSGRKFTGLYDFIRMGVNYRANMGFETRIENYDVVRDTALRIGYNFMYSNMQYRIFPKKAQDFLNFTELQLEFFEVINPNGSFNESANFFDITWNFRNTSEFALRAYANWADVPVSFKFDGEDISVCPALAPGQYRYQSGEMRWSSNYRKRFNLTIKGGGGGFYSGNQAFASVELNYRIQPIVNFRLSAAYTILNFPTPLCDLEIFNITPRVEVFFAKNIWWTTFLQYNTQSDNFNINSRLQWRFRPMSDVFLVYTDNYAVQMFGPKNRALVLKVNYWW